jgi:hypothetical protein
VHAHLAHGLRFYELKRIRQLQARMRQDLDAGKHSILLAVCWSIGQNRYEILEALARVCRARNLSAKKEGFAIVFTLNL